jgi:hypothetical protein
MLNYLHFTKKDSMFCNVKLTHEVKYISIGILFNHVIHKGKVGTIQVNGF